MQVTISAAVEGVTDEAVIRRLIAHVGASPGPIYGKNGKANLKAKIAGYNNAANHEPWVVLVDLDRDAECAPQLRVDWLPSPSAHLCFRVAIRAVESWLMADAEALAAFLGVNPAKIPSIPESIPDPKAALVNLARASKTKAIREDMVPRQGSGRSIGPAYTSRVIEFASNKWRPACAAQRAESLDRAIRCLQELAKTWSSSSGDR